jgi:ketosteroid isomerase-like protein
VGIVEQYLACITTHDWHGLGACVTDDVVRVGPFGDTYCGRDEYVAFLAGLMPTLAGYEMRVHRTVYTADGRVAMAELTETVRTDDRVVVTPESLVFDIAGNGRIERIRVYIQRSKP